MFVYISHWNQGGEIYYGPFLKYFGCPEICVYAYSENNAASYI
jgi:hypothetical protein